MGIRFLEGIYGGKDSLEPQGESWAVRPPKNNLSSRILGTPISTTP